MEHLHLITMICLLLWTIADAAPQYNGEQEGNSGERFIPWTVRPLPQAEGTNVEETTAIPVHLTGISTASSPASPDIMRGRHPFDDKTGGFAAGMMRHHIVSNRRSAEDMDKIDMDSNQDDLEDGELSDTMEDGSDDETNEGPFRRRRDVSYSASNSEIDEWSSESDSEGNDLHRYRRDREDQTTPRTSLVVVAPSDMPVQKIPDVLREHLDLLKERINTFEQKATQNVSSIPVVGVVAGEKAPSETDTVVHTLTSSQYIVH